jgi:hypothetical protein
MHASGTQIFLTALLGIAVHGVAAEPVIREAVDDMLVLAESSRYESNVINMSNLIFVLSLFVFPMRRFGTATRPAIDYIYFKHFEFGIRLLQLPIYC